MSNANLEQENADERLKDIFRRLMELYERHAQERQLIIKEREEINRLVQVLVGQTKEIGQYENGIRKRIQDCIRDSAEKSMEKIEKGVTEKSAQSMDKIFEKIKDVCKAIEEVVSLYRIEKNKFIWRTIALTILIGIVSNLGVVLLRSVL